MNIEFDEQHRLPYDKAVLETSVGIRIALGNDREKYCFTPATVDFVSSSPAHAMSLRLQRCFKPVNGPKTFQDAMDPYETRNCPRTLIRKVLYQAGPLQDSAQI
ncbi:hypothetical protein TNCT_403391 [Trichonephila clavata]|uniref:Uncharacterized protein n=1 Tax=Trichonephila clavata TaxID=2740835 RepID=A0A8X6HBL9_TRICU|nr:hypothetical protein TNCT_403391 [Trichonephila clavata]